MSLITPEPTSALAPIIPGADGILPASPQLEYRTLGINTESGQLYLYGPTPRDPGPTIPAIWGQITDVAVTQHGNSGGRGGNSWDGARDHLDVRVQTAVPTLVYLLRLPAYRGQWHYRSLLGALLDLALNDTPVKLEARRGREATFIQVSLDPEGLQPVKAPCIGPTRDDLEIAVNACRRSIGLAPQFCD